MGRPLTPTVLYFPATKQCLLYQPHFHDPYQLLPLPSQHEWEEVERKYPRFRKQQVGSRTNVPYAVLRSACKLLGCESNYPCYFMPSSQWCHELRQYVDWPSHDKPIVDFQWRAIKDGNPNYPTYQ